jgi:hypothetical protein
MKLFVDKIEKFDLGGSTTDLRKAEYILAAHNLTFEKILNTTPKTTKLPSGMFVHDRFVVAFNISWDLKNVNIGFINYLIDLDEYFDTFADSMSPKAVAGFHKLREKIKEKDSSELHKTELSDDELEFEIAYQIYKDNKHRQ